MTKRNLEGFGPDSKAPKKKRGSQGRFAFHASFHGDVLLGMQTLDDGERGVYVTIYMQMYQMRSALPLDHAWLARICNIPVQRLRARLASLVAKARIVVDEEQGLVYDERTMRELVAMERYNQAQADRIKSRWTESGKGPKAKPELRVVAGDTLVEIRKQLAEAENVSGAEQIQPPPQPTPQTLGQTPENHGRRRLSVEQDQSPSGYRSDTNQYPYPINPLTPSNDHEEGAPDRGPPMPSLRAGGPPNEARKRRLEALAALDLLKGGGAETPKGFEGEQSEPDEPDHPADRKARREP